jgi:(1->4)-alpha-D-glucan 1-alpha-D-glucosylmutase
MSSAGGPPDTPRATYRLQFSKEFRFADAERIVPYLAALGVSHVYASPLLMARPGSTHGYDIVDHNRINPEIGDHASFDALVAALHRHGMGLILDFVPNHMGVGSDNTWWVDVLEWGRESRYAAFFDIDWDPLEQSLAGRVLLPVLGDHYGAVLERGELQLRLDPQQGSFGVTYFASRFPIAPHDYPVLLRAAGTRSDEAARVLEPIIADLQVSLRDGRGRHAAMLRQQRVAEQKHRLATVLSKSAAAQDAVADAIDALNGTPDDPRSFDGLHHLLERQAYRLAFWRVAAYEINYRRFFDINDLAGLRMEQPELFDASHRLVQRLLADGKIQGVRLDHVDGLRDPAEYFQRLQRLAAAGGGRTQPLYVLVEKILAPHESLRATWAVSGTTGYEFMAAVNGVFVDRRGERSLTRFYERLVGRTFDLEQMIVDAKRQIMREALASELNVLANIFHRLAKQDRATIDFTFTGFREALASIISHFPVYRTYVTEAGATREDHRDLDWAVGKARRAARAPDTSIYDFIGAVLTLDILKQGRAYRRRDVRDVALRCQQFTGAVMAKAMEDTTFYRYVRLVSLNEVGSEPGHFGTPPGVFHEANRRRLREHPFAMVTTATHDHKRGEDVRARLDVLSEIPREWAHHVHRWVRLNNRKRREVDGRHAPDRNDEYLFYQTVAGAWPYALTAPAFAGIEAFQARVGDYMLKAAREAKLRTSWAARNEDYESALSDFVARTLDPRQSRPFIEDMERFVRLIAVTGATNGLAQTLLKLVSPGVPDTYQGTEFWDLSLVDPDNRRAVDYRVREEALGAAGAADCPALLRAWQDGRIKQHVLRRALALRREQPALFAAGEYQPLEIVGPEAERVIAIARTYRAHAVIAVVPRLAWPLMQHRQQPLPDGWGTTHLLLQNDGLHGRTMIDVMSGEAMTVSADGAMAVGRVLRAFPVALLTPTPDEAATHATQ